LIQIDLFDETVSGAQTFPMNDIMGIAVSGMRAASTRLSVHAENIANQQTEGYRPVRPVQTTGPAGEAVVQVQRLPPEQAQQRIQGTDFVVPQTSLEGEMVGTMESETAYKASAKLVKTAREMDQALFDILA
jgi:flagellar hook-associated protein FlgK